MPVWKPTYKIRRSSNILSFGVRGNFEALNLMGESCFLLKRMARADAPEIQMENRRISTISKTASAFTTDPDTGMIRYKLWGADNDPVDEYPDIYVFTATVQASGGTSVWESAVDKYSFIEDREEYAFDIYQDEIRIVAGNEYPIENAMYIVFNTPPFSPTNITFFNFGIINPLVKFEGMQPIRDTKEYFKRSLFGFNQWTKSNARIRSLKRPHRFLLAFPGVLSDFTITDGGLLKDSRASFWTTPPPYSPEIVEYDIVVRESTGQRFQIVNYTPIYIENILVSQHFDLVELDPRSTIYDISIITS